MKYNKYLILGGDLRSLHLYDILQKEGNKVKISGFSEYKNEQKPVIQNILELEKALENTEIVIGPIPCCGNGDNLNAPFNSKYISVEDVLEHMNEDQIFIAGRISWNIIEKAKSRNIKIFDILERDEMAILNAIPTAEGAIQIAMEKMKIVLHGSNALVLGYGNIGKILAKMLHGIGTNVHITCRKYSDAALIRSYGYESLSYGQLADNLNKMDVIFNTVPSLVLDKGNLRYINEDCVIIELASKPFGIDQQECRKEGLTITWAPSLPGKVAPVTAADYIRETICNIVNEME